ncbi:MAG: histidine kinase [Haliscomenobacter sp.]|nr:histidine kinase [Haliscomenobacter sp.]MBK9490903.1 histidine kinase [Haliscomenobacter sp.]
MQAQNEDGIWSASTSLRLAIHPPGAGQLRWARIGTIVVALFLFFGVYKFRIGQLKKQNQIQQQITELERAALQAQMNPHFIFNCLNSIQNYILQNEKDSAILYLGRFCGFGEKCVNASVAGKILLEDELNMLNNYLNWKSYALKNRFTYEVKSAKGRSAVRRTVWKARMC